MFFSPKAWLIVLAATTSMFAFVFNLEIPFVSTWGNEDQQLRFSLAQRSAQRIAMELTTARIFTTTRPMIAIAPSVNDVEGILTNQLKTWIGRRNVRVINASRFSKLRSLTSSNPTSIEQSIQSYLNGSAEWIVVCDVHNWTTYPEYEAALEGIVLVYNRAGEQVLRFALSPDSPGVEGDSFTEETKATTALVSHGTIESLDFSAAKREYSMALGFSLPFALGLLIWLTAVLALPIMFRNQIRRWVYRRNNGINARIMICWGTMCVLGAWALLTSANVTLASFATAITAGLAACTYLGSICQRMEASL
jgi:hypothetical protein